MLLVVEDFDTLKRLFPTPEHRARTEASFKRLTYAYIVQAVVAAGGEIGHGAAG